MDLLVLGGTRFLGRHLVDDALRRGHRVTLFNRGEGRSGLFEEVEEEVPGKPDSDRKIGF